MKANGYVFLNGRIVDASRATVSVYDRGLLYGDGLFETMRAYKGVAFAIDEHFHRLRTSADILGLPIPTLDWPATITELLRRNGLERQDAWVRLTITRGPAEPRVLPPDLSKPTTIIMVRGLDREIALHQKRGVKVALLPFSRYGFIPEHKSVNYLAAVVGKVLASYHGAYEGLFVRHDHVLTEGTTTSVFIVRDGALMTAPEGGILPGVTRRLVIDLARAAGVRVSEREITTTDLRLADEAFLTSSMIELVPIVLVDETPVGKGTPGPLTAKLQKRYAQAVKDYLKVTRSK
ncbi:MAG: aminotransferase class IV [Candidatus Binatia bacterium]